MCSRYCRFQLNVRFTIMWPKAITQVFEWIRGMFLKVCGRRKRLRSGLNTHENLVRRKRMRTNSSSSSTSRSSTPHRQPGPSRSRGPQSPRYPVPNRNRQRRFQPQRYVLSVPTFE